MKRLQYIVGFYFLAVMFFSVESQASDSHMYFDGTEGGIGFRNAAKTALVNNHQEFDYGGAKFQFNLPDNKNETQNKMIGALTNAEQYRLKIAVSFDEPLRPENQSRSLYGPSTFAPMGHTLWDPKTGQLLFPNFEQALIKQFSTQSFGQKLAQGADALKAQREAFAAQREQWRNKR